jgi:hypothetical protein
MIHSLPLSFVLARQVKHQGLEGLEKMWIARLPSGVEIDVSGGLRVLEIENGFYVVGQEMLISVNSREEGLEEIRKIKQNEC